MIQLVANSWSEDGEDVPYLKDVSSVYFELADKFMECQAELYEASRGQRPTSKSDLTIALEPLAFRPKGSSGNAEEAKLQFPVGRGTMAVLNYLSDHDGQATPTEIANGVFVSTSRISGILSTLEKRGWVTRRHDDVDRRKVIVNLTEEGARNVEGTAKTIRSALVAILSDLGEEDGRKLIDLLQQTADFVNAHPGYVLDMRIRKVAED